MPIEEMIKKLDPDTMVSGIRLGSIRIPGSTMEDVKRYVILATIHEMNGSTSKAAQELQISVRTIQYHLKEWGSSAARAKVEAAIEGMS